MPKTSPQKRLEEVVVEMSLLARHSQFHSVVGGLLVSLRIDELMKSRMQYQGLLQDE